MKLVVFLTFVLFFFETALASIENPGPGDLNSDGFVDFYDYSIAAESNSWNQIASVAANWLHGQRTPSYGPKLAGSDGSGNSDANAININSTLAFQKLMSTPADWGKHFKQSRDIDFAGATVNSIGYYDAHTFTGTYDGQCFKMSNINVARNSNELYNTQGVFGCVGSTGQLENLIVSNAILSGNVSLEKDQTAAVGILAGWLLSGARVSNCAVNGSITYAHATASANTCAIGILVGQNSGQISGCSTSGSINFSCSSPSSWIRVGGVVGWQWGGTVIGYTQNCLSSVTIQCNSSVDANCVLIGGICGYLEDYESYTRNYLRYCKWDGILDISNTQPCTVFLVGGVVGQGHSDFDSCLAQGTITVNSATTVDKGCYGGLCVGGICGLMTDNMALCGADCNISVNYATRAYVGGAIGDCFYGGSVSDCYALGTLYDLKTASYSLAFPDGGGGFAGRIVGLNPTRCWCATRHSFAPGNPAVSAFSGVLTVANPAGCFWNKDAISDSNSPGLTGKTTLELETQSTFTNAGYDFNTTPIWTIQPGCYPSFAWETYASFDPPQ